MDFVPLCICIQWTTKLQSRSLQLVEQNTDCIMLSSLDKKI